MSEHVPRASVQVLAEVMWAVRHMSITMVSLKPVQAFLNFWIGSAAHCEVFTFLWRLVQVCDSCTRATVPQYVRLCSSNLPARKQVFRLAHVGTSILAAIHKELTTRN